MDEQAIFDAARVIADRDARRRYLDEACGSDRALRERVEALLRVHDRDTAFLEIPYSVEEENPGTAIGPYTLLGLIGEGGMGVVYRAEQSQPVKREVALKIIKPGTDSRQVMARFEVERQALALMDHPNIAKVFEAGSTNSGRPYFVMELVRGIAITKYCDQHHLNPRQRLELFIPVCQAVQHAHQKGIIHRDLKPSNILVALYDGRPVPKIIDFGVAKAIGDQLTVQPFDTAIGSVVGTLQYMSPEQAAAEQKDIDTRSDVYSLGVILYELLTGTTPFGSKRFREAALMEVVRIIREEEPPKPSTRISSADELPSIAANRGLEPKKLSGLVRGDLDWIVMKSLEKDRTRRYATANGLSRDIERYLNEEPVEACPPSASYRFRKFAKRHKAGLATTAAFVLLLISAVVVSAWQAVRATRAERLANDERDKVVAEKERADQQAAIAHSVSEFLQKDLLGQSDIANQPAVAERNRNITVRELLDRTAKGIEGKFAGQELTEAAIRATLGCAYRALGEYGEAQKHLERAVELRKQKQGASSKDTVEAMANLATVLLDRGRLDDAGTLYNQALTGAIATFGENHSTTLRIISNLAMVDIRLGQSAAAEVKLQRAVDGFRNSLGADHPSTFVAMNNLASLLTTLGQYDKAISQLRQVVDGMTAKHGSDHPHTLHAQTNLGKTYLQARRFNEAEPVLNEVLELRRAKIGADHPETQNTIHDLALVYVRTEQFAKAEPLFKEGLGYSRIKPGPTHANTMRFMNGLAMMYSKSGRKVEAEKQFLEVLSIRRETLGPDSPDTLVSVNNLGAHYQAHDQLDKAEPLFVEAAAGARRVLDPRDPDRAKYIDNLADLYGDTNRMALAEPLLRETAQLVRVRRGPQSLDAAAALGRLAQNLLMQEKYADAESVARECLAIRIQAAPDNWLTFHTQSLLGAALLGQKKYADAEPDLVKAAMGLKQREQQINSKYQKYLRAAMKRVVQLYDETGKQGEAEKWRSQLPPGR